MALHRSVRAAALALAFASMAALAAPDEIQVYTEELNDPGEFGVELHINHVPKGTRTPAYPGELPSNHLLQVMPEFSYGISRTLEAGLYLPVAMGPDGQLYQNGARMRLKYMAPREEAAAFFWGINTEAGFYSRRVSESRWAMELRPIVGYRGDTWMASFNPIVDFDLSANVSRKPSFHPALKAGRKAAEGTWIGLEYYGDYGPLASFVPARERSHSLFVAADVEMKGFDFNIGVGRGFVNAGDAWVVKAIVSLPFK
jgi:hypothetical protein